MAATVDEQSSEPLKYQTWVLKVSIHCEGCKKKVKKVLQSVEGVYTTSIDSQQQKVTVTGNIEVETLIRKLLKAGKHAEIWPENLFQKKSGKGKNKGKKKDPKGMANHGDGELKNSQNDAQLVDDSEEDENTAKFREGEGSEKAGKLTGNSPDGEGLAEVDNKSSGNGEKGGGGHHGKKKKKKGRSSNNANGGSGSSMAGAPASTGTQFQDSVTGQVSGIPNLSPPRHQPNPYPNVTMPPPIPVYAYNAAYHSRNLGPYYHLASQPYTYANPDPARYPTRAQPLDPFVIFSDENPNGCSIM